MKNKKIISMKEQNDRDTDNKFMRKIKLRMDFLECTNETPTSALCKRSISKTTVRFDLFCFYTVLQ